MSKTFTFNQLRKIKDMLPDGTIQRIADELGLNSETVRNYFGGSNFKEGKSSGIHIEPGPDGGIVQLEDTGILERALAILKEEKGIDLDLDKGLSGIKESLSGLLGSDKDSEATADEAETTGLGGMIKDKLSGL